MNPDDVRVSSCGGRETGTWGENFAFDDSNDRLYLSSGNHVPSAIFMISDAGLDAISDTSTVTQVHDSSCDSTQDMDFPPGNLLYFVDGIGGSDCCNPLRSLIESGCVIHKLDLNEDPISTERDRIVFLCPDCRSYWDRINSFKVIRWPVVPSPPFNDAHTRPVIENAKSIGIWCN